MKFCQFWPNFSLPPIYLSIADKCPLPPPQGRSVCKTAAQVQAPAPLSQAATPLWRFVAWRVDSFPLCLSWPGVAEKIREARTSQIFSSQQALMTFVFIDFLFAKWRIRSNPRTESCISRSLINFGRLRRHFERFFLLEQGHCVPTINFPSKRIRIIVSISGLVNSRKKHEIINGLVIRC